MSTPPPKRYEDVAPWPPEGELDLPSLLSGGGPIEIDVGIGRGMSLFERAAAAPDSRILGIEIKQKWAYRVEQRRLRLGLDRVRVFAGDARSILRRSGPDGCVQRAFLHFPDPWWKKRHAKRRVVAPDLLDMFGRLLRAGGELFLQTDVQERADDYLRLLRAHPLFEVPAPGGFTANNPFGARSNRERRAGEDGLPVYRILALRVGGAAAEGGAHERPQGEEDQ